MKLTTKFPLLGLLAATLGATLAMSTGVATASSVTSIQSVLVATLPSSAPFVLNATGTYTAYGANGTPVDTGTVEAQGVLPAQPPKATQIETFRTYTSSDHVSSLQLHCSEISRPGAPAGTVTGRCAVLKATGVYAGLTGSGPATGATTIPPPTLSDTISL